MTIARLLICAAVLLPLPSLAVKPAPVRSVQGVVSAVVSGDSLTLLPTGQAPIAVRLRDIDAPGACQPGADEARRALAELALNKVATLHLSGRDALGRTVGAVVVDGVDLGPRLVEDGQAWSIRTRHDQGPLVKQERMAHALGRGVHGAVGAVSPRDFRRDHGPCGGGEAAAETARPPTAAAAPARPPTVAAPVTPPLRAPVVAPVSAPVPAPLSALRAAPPVAAAVASRSRCDGRTRCTQMTSCSEARFFLANCPNVQMDGNHDGVPCEQQWCK